MRRVLFLLSAAVLTLVLAGTGDAAAAAVQPEGRPPGAPSAVALKRALVIGNGAYATAPLENARGDAILIAETLRKTGFEVTLVKDLTRTGMFDAVRSFAASLPRGAVSVVYFAGHGMQIEGQNYLIPVDMVPTSPVTAALKSFPLKVIYEQLGASRSRVNVIILDACRNNPFEPQPAVRVRSPGAMGLARSLAPRGTLIAYATAPGQQAADGTGRRHSLYTQTLSELLLRDGLPVEELFKTLADRVRQVTLEDQQPWYESSLVGTFYFGAPVTAGADAQAGRKAALALAQQTRAIPAASPAVPSPAGHAGDAAWYRTMNDLEWTELDNQMWQRATHASEDQVPALQTQIRKNNVVAMTTLAMFYRAGIKSGVNTTTGQRYRADPNLTKAVALYRRAAALGFPVAQAELGEMLYRGREVEMDKAEGLRLLERAAEASYPRASIDLAQIRAEKSRSPEDIAALMKLLFDNTTKVQHQATQRR